MIIAYTSPSATLLGDKRMVLGWATRKEDIIDRV
jgi:hypothetical protein